MEKFHRRKGRPWSINGSEWIDQGSGRWAPSTRVFDKEEIRRKEVLAAYRPGFFTVLSQFGSSSPFITHSLLGEKGKLSGKSIFSFLANKQDGREE